MLEELKNKVVLITGATSGIGKATAIKFAITECRTMLTGRNEDVLNNLKNEIEAGKGVCSHLAGDLTDSNFRENLLANTIKTFNKLDILINAAGIISSGTIENLTLEEFDEMMDINLRSVFHLIRLAVPHLVNTQGNIVNVSSVAGLRAFPGLFSYCVSKAGLDQLTRAAALDLAPKNVRVNAVNPGVVLTNLHLRSGMSKQKYEKFLNHSKTTHPLGRVGNPQEIADLILFLASPKAGWITGETISIDGGRQLTCAR